MITLILPGNIQVFVNTTEQAADLIRRLQRGESASVLIASPYGTTVECTCVMGNPKGCAVHDRGTMTDRVVVSCDGSNR